MASSSSSNSWILSLKVLLISAGVVSVAVTMKLAVPLMLNFAVYDLPVIWSVVISWLKPPYLYVVINGIIITIAASTRFQHNHNHENHQSQQHVNPPTALPTSDLPSDLLPVPIQPSTVVVERPVAFYDIEPSVMEPRVVYESEPAVVDVEMVAESGPEVVGRGEDEFATSRSTWNLPQSIINSPPPMKVQPEFSFPVREKQFLSSRFANHRKSIGTIPEGVRALRVLKPKKHETMEATWKMITEKSHIPLTKHRRKSEAFIDVHDNPQPEEYATQATAKKKVVKKSETFKDRTNFEIENHYPINSSPATRGKLIKEGSLSDDELNRRVEAFIKKFNDDMRLQRQESLNQYREMVNRGAH